MPAERDALMKDLELRIALKLIVGMLQIDNFFDVEFFFPSTLLITFSACCTL
jgi:hypothetical protein